MQELAVITLTNGSRPEWLELCADSVRRNLPPGATHHILNCPNLDDFVRIRLNSLNLAKYVVNVDDDDLVINDSIRRCLETIKEEKVSVAFTDEIMINETGIEFDHRALRTGLRYSDIVASVRTIHHTAILETSMVHDQVSQLVNNLSTCSGIDWLIVASAALRGGAAHVPMYGYKWRQHLANQHRGLCETFNTTFPFYNAFLSTMLMEDKLIKRLQEDTSNQT